MRIHIGVRNESAAKAVSLLNMRKLLIDRKWHSVAWVMAELAGRIPPETCVRIFNTAVPSPRTRSDSVAEWRAKRAAMPIDIKRDNGLYLLVLETLRRMTKCGGHLERRGVGRHAEFRLRDWYCWQCGHRQNDRRPPSGMCPECKELFDLRKRGNAIIDAKWASKALEQ